MKFLATLMLAAMLFIAACATGPSVCDTMAPNESILCDTANKYGVKLEDIGNTLIVANAVAIGEGLYTSGQALQVVKSLRSILDDDITYLFFRDELMQWTSEYPGLFEVAMIYLSDFGFDIGLTSTDRNMLQEWFDARIETLENYK